MEREVGRFLGRGGRGTGVCLKRGDGKNGKSQGINKNRDGICENKKVRGEVYETKKDRKCWVYYNCIITKTGKKSYTFT